jgi:2-methylisocitrate lyase-like PEP mutase family enzyme
VNGLKFRAAAADPVVPFIGVYDVFSASLAAKYYRGLFVSGFGFAASYYGLPDIGFIAWPDILAFVHRLRIVLPDHRLLVDIDDGYCDAEIACHVVSVLESLGAFGVVMEDQKRPRKCGHFSGKEILDLDEYLVKLRRVLRTRRDLFVVARTDSSDPADIMRRVRAFADAGADAVLVDGLKDFNFLSELTAQVDRPFFFNQIAGGKSPPCNLQQLKEAGVSFAIYSTPCLFAAQQAVEGAMSELLTTDGYIPPPGEDGVGVAKCTAVLNDNLARRSAGPTGDGAGSIGGLRPTRQPHGVGRR